MNRVLIYIFKQKKLGIIPLSHILSDINECLSTPCQNEATCHNEVNAYSCTCMPGYQGTNCESGI